ncbi:S1C family serine protease [Halostreptopolyspora alba]|uniref:PDZ domain-containing protein n=1 Tax=Halostreptopolyspora alba TaxID=2487137 RepID=A0A3N0E1C1_9ACTN|nr:PDZ domain-containing protein [Nocardiopsaceae bacterium YIM 96095]
MSASDHTSGGREEGRQDTVQPAPGPQPQWAAADGGTQVFSATPGPPQPPEGGHVPNGPGGGAHPGGQAGTSGYASAGGPGGFGPPPPPPGAATPAPAPPPGNNGPRGRVLFVAAVTALITSLIVGPATALLALHLTGSGQPLSSLGEGQASSRSTGDVSEVADKALPSVVSIQVGEGGGSGVVISSDGQILTNAHVIRAQGEDEAIRVQFNDGEEAEAELLGADPVSDLAVVQAEGQSGRTPAVFGDSDKVEVGADVVAIGSPLGLSGTVTSGVVSALDRPVNTGIVEQQPDEESEDEQAPIPGFPFEDPTDPESEQQPQAQTSRVINAIQADAPINPGNSGGPLVNMNGEVIGINTAIAGSGNQMGTSGSIGLGFSIPINQAQPIAEQLVTEGQADYAAIEATITGTRDASGAEIVEVAEDGAAEQAGLEEGDVITEVEGEEISDPDKLIATVRSHQPGDTITIGYERDGDTDEVDVTLSAQSAESIGN